MMSCSAAIKSCSTDLAKARSSTAPSAIDCWQVRGSATLSNKSAVNSPHSLRVVEDHSDRMAMAGADAADAVSQINAVEPARPLHRAMVHGKGDRIALAERHYFRPRLHARALFGQYELAAGEIAPRFRQEDRDLQREHMLAVEILMQAIVITGLILQQQRGGPGLARGMTAFQECLVAIGIADIDAHRLVPVIGDIVEPPVERGPQPRDQIGKRIGEIFVFAAAKAVTSHDDQAAKVRIITIDGGKRTIRIARQQSTQYGSAM